MDVKSFKENKMQTVPIAAVILMAVSLFGFSTGLSFGGDWGWLIGGAVWAALTVIQIIGNDEENRQDFILMAGWVFTYILGIGASTWAMYSWINIPVDELRWAVAFGLGGATEILPERLFVLWWKARKPAQEKKEERKEEKKPDLIRMPRPEHQPTPPHSTYKPQHRPQLGSKVPPSPQRPPEHRRLDADDRDPTYRTSGLFAGENRRHEKERYDERD